MSDVIQQTLSGGETDVPQESPSTFVTCEECGERMLRSEVFDHERDIDGEESTVAGSNLKPEYRYQSDDSSGGGV